MQLAILINCTSQEHLKIYIVFPQDNGEMETDSPNFLIFFNIHGNKWKSSYKSYIMKAVNEREDLL